MQTLLRDLQYGFRMLLKNRGTTAVAMLALSLSIGANTAIFSVVNSVLLRPMLYRDSEHLMVVWATQLSKGIQQELISAPKERCSEADRGARRATGRNRYRYRTCRGCRPHAHHLEAVVRSKCHGSAHLRRDGRVASPGCPSRELYPRSQSD